MITRVALTIAGSDSSGGAGIQADLRTFAALGFHGLSVVTAVTSQTASAVRHVFPTPQEVVAAQLGAVLEDFAPDACKIGMVPTASCAEVIAERLRAAELRNVVVDPVIAAGDGTPLVAEDAWRAVAEKLFCLAAMVTPNLAEAGALLDGDPPRNAEEMAQAAQEIAKRYGAAAVLVTGGHLEGEAATDVLYDGKSVRQFPANRVATAGRVRGTGCMLSSAIACNLAYGMAAQRAVSEAKEYVLRRIISARRVGRSHAVIG